MIRRSAPWLAGFVAIAVMTTLLCRDFTKILWGVESTAGVTELRAAVSRPVVASFDVPHYIDYASQLREKGNLLSWQSAFWPPGMALVGSSMVALGGENAYPLHMTLLAALVWALCLFSWFQVVRPKEGAWILFVVLNVPWLLPSFREWALEVGALESESLAAAFFCLSLVAFVGALRSAKEELLYGAIGLLTVAAYFRAEFDVYGLAILCTVLAVAAVRALRRKEDAREILRLPVMLLLVFFALTLPWKMFMKSRYGHFGMSVAMYVSAERAFWNREPATFAFGGNAPCMVEPETCDLISAHKDDYSMEKKLSLAERAFFKHPFAWLAYKVQFLDRFWFGAPLDELFGSRFGALLDGLFYVFCAGLGIFIWGRAIPKASGETREKLQLAALVLGAFVAIYVAVFVLAPLEIRYTLPPRVACLFSPLLFWGLATEDREAGPAA